MADELNMLAQAGLFFSIEYNDHKSVYESVSDYLNTREAMEVAGYQDDDLAAMIESDTIWSIQIYPRTPIAFYIARASTFERALQMINEDFNPGGHCDFT